MAESSNRLRFGDKVTHWSHGDQQGTVVAVEPDEYSSTACTYHVQWPEGGIPVPYYSVTTTLRKVEGGGE